VERTQSLECTVEKFSFPKPDIFQIVHQLSVF